MFSEDTKPQHFINHYIMLVYVIPLHRLEILLASNAES
jgi:hypothetical protein